MGLEPGVPDLWPVAARGDGSSLFTPSARRCGHPQLTLGKQIRGASGAHWLVGPKCTDGMRDGGVYQPAGTGYTKQRNLPS